MSKIFIFFLLATCTVLLSVAIIAVGPITNKKVGVNWGYQNCQLLADQEKLMKGDVTSLKYMKNLCYRQKAMHDMEYTSFIINIVLGFICADLAFLHHLGIGKDFEMKTGVIGLISGIIGFILTLVYVCFSGYIFNNDAAFKNPEHDSDLINKLYSNGALYKIDSSSSIYPYSNDKSYDSQYIKYKDLGDKQYNYNKKFYETFYGLKSNSVSVTGCGI